MPTATPRIIVRGATIYLTEVVTRGIQAKKYPDKELIAARTKLDLFPNGKNECEYSLIINKHLGAERVVYPE